MRRTVLIPVAAAVLTGALLVAACGGDQNTGPDPGPDPGPVVEPRTYAVGWAPSAPRPDVELFLALVDSIAQVSDVTIIQQPVPWPELLAGAPIDSLVTDRANVAAFMRAHGLDIIWLVDPLDGLNRRLEDPGLVDAGRSILEPEIRAMHDDWVLRITAAVQPEWMGLASEINTLAAVGDPALYAAILDMSNTLAPQVRGASPGTQVFVSFQVDQANGFLGDPVIDHFALIDDFDIDALGLSSYPVFVFDDPADVPDNYFAVFDAATDLPLIFVEGGWNSADTQITSGTPQEQVDFLARYEELFDGVNLELWVMLTFTDLDIPALDLPPDRAATLSNFAFMGLLDIDLNRKPAYAEWKRIFDRPLR
ncbi:MAG: hypothetical protein V3S56_07810 [Gemmatimonadota bacterium]